MGEKGYSVIAAWVSTTKKRSCYLHQAAVWAGLTRGDIHEGDFAHAVREH
jgi:hypothetical protein